MTHEERALDIMRKIQKAYRASGALRRAIGRIEVGHEWGVLMAEVNRLLVEVEQGEDA